MSDDDVETIIREAMEYWGRGEDKPDELKTRLAQIPDEQSKRVWNRICDEAAR